MRHVSRTHRVALDWLFDRINLDPKIQIKYIDTKNQLADNDQGKFHMWWMESSFCVCLTLAISVLQSFLRWCRKERNKNQVMWTWACVSPWANAVCVHLNKKKESRDDDTNNKDKRLQKQTSSAVVQSTAFTSHWMYSWVFTCFSSLHMLLGLSLCVPNSLVINAPNLFTFWLVREFLVQIHTAKMDLWGVVLTHRNKKFWKSHDWGFIQRRQTTGLPVLPCRFARKLIFGLSLNYQRLHQESLHCHQLDEELDDWCHFWYFQNGTGLRCSPDSWCGRFNVVIASLKSERSLTGQVFPELLREIHQFFLYRKYSACVMW